MRRLLDVEIRRMLARRAVRVAAILAFLAVLTTGTLATMLSNPNVSVARERRRIERAQEIRQCLGGTSIIVPEVSEGPVDLASFCDAGYSPDAAAAQLETRTRLDALGDVYLGIAGPFAIMALILGATFIGAEWGSRSMSGTLMWEPRRARLLAAKAAACALVVAAGCAVFLAALGGAIAFAASMRGTTAGANLAWLGHVAALGGRVVAVAVFAALIGVAVTAASRSAAASIGAAFVLLAPVEGAIRGLRPGWRSWLIGDNAGLFLTGASSAELPGRTSIAASLVVAFYVVVLLAVATAIFRRRDIA
jgi:ABC-type transport system involved in multi-copper enzyme maturation permease subunit